MACFSHINDTFDFGKYKSHTLSWVLQFDPQYVDWCIQNVTSKAFLIEDTALLEIKMAYPLFPITEDFEFYRIRRLMDEAWIVNTDIDDNDSAWFDDIEPDPDYDPYEVGYYNEPQTYDNYRGSWVQDVEGWSDQDIEDVLDGEPDAYWNID